MSARDPRGTGPTTAAPTGDDLVRDVIGIGLGPFNLGLACLTDPLPEVDALFLESKDAFSWHPGMLLESSTLQVPFLADLVTLADPTSRFSFLAHLKESGRLYRFYVRESFYPLRREFDRYCRWAAEQLPTVRWSRHVVAVEHDDAQRHYLVHSVDTRTGDRHVDRARRLVLGVGTPAHVPEAVRHLRPRTAAPDSTSTGSDSDSGSGTGSGRGIAGAPGVVDLTATGGPVVHTGEYLARKDDLQAADHITIVGSGQSAAEVYRDLLPDARRLGYRLDWVTRSPRFFPLEYTKLTLEMTSPDYTDYFHALPQATRDALLADQAGLYKGIDGELVDEIYDLLYELDLDGAPPTRLLTATELVSATRDGDGYRLGLRHVEQDRRFELTTGAIVLATGYRQQVPGFLAPVRDRLRLDDRGRFDVRRDYSVDVDGGEVFVQNAELHTHGFVAPDLGMAAYRNAQIIRSLTGREVYPVERTTTFQEFGAPDPAPVELPATPLDAARRRTTTAHTTTPHTTTGHTTTVPGLGRVELRPVDVEAPADLDLLHAWVTAPRARFWQMGGATRDDVAAAYREIAAAAHHEALWGVVDGSSRFLVERYDPRHDAVGAAYPVAPGDVGMHLLVGPADGPPQHGYTTAVMTAVLDVLFADPAVERVVVEPDVENTAIHVLNERVGFVAERDVDLGCKRARLSFCTRAAFEAATHAGSHR